MFLCRGLDPSTGASPDPLPGDRGGLFTSFSLLHTRIAATNSTALQIIISKIHFSTSGIQP